VLVEEEGSTCMADNDSDSEEARSLRPQRAAACTNRIAFGPRAGQKLLTVQGVMPRARSCMCALAAFAAQRQAREIALRRLMGAGIPQVAGLLLWRLTRPVLLAALIACPLAWWTLALGAARRPITPRAGS
jgi:hypothetical protein